MTATMGVVNGYDMVGVPAACTCDCCDRASWDIERNAATSFYMHHTYKRTSHHTYDMIWWT